MLFIGPHVSISTSIALAVERANALGATGFGLFTKNQRQWKSKNLENSEIIAFKENMERFGFSYNALLPHAGYLINPATPDEELRIKSLELFQEEANRVGFLGINRINIHPGAFKEGDRKEGIKRTANMLDSVLSSHPKLKIAIENTAGAGTILGSTFEELSEILENIKQNDRVGFTLDTAHLFASGYDVKDDITGVLDDFIARFGSDKLYGMHLNDSKAELSSHKDRHDNLGLGLIGIEAFIEIVRRKEVQNKPLILETPNEELWKNEIKALQEACPL